jgi:hypothetical protein
MVNSYCPLGKWQQRWSILICNPTRQNIRVAYKLSDVIVIGDVPGWYIGKSMPFPPRYHNRCSDELRWLQKTIDSNHTTENFLWVGGELPNLPFQQLRIPRYTADPIHPLDEELLVANNLPQLNYNTPWPQLYNKGKLQDVLDKHKAPYNMATIYHNTYSTNNTQYTYKIYNTFGQLIDANTTTDIIDITNNTKGLYLINLQLENQTKTFKVILN